jgi:hypothetical protein
MKYIIVVWAKSDVNVKLDVKTIHEKMTRKFVKKQKKEFILFLFHVLLYVFHSMSDFVF